MSILYFSSQLIFRYISLSGHTEIAEVLLSRGCEALKPDNNGVRPLHYAAQNNFGKTLDAMLMHDNVKDMPDNDGRTALMWAAAKGLCVAES